MLSHIAKTLLLPLILFWLAGYDTAAVRPCSNVCGGLVVIFTAVSLLSVINSRSDYQQVMDPISALSVAAAVVQFIQFGCSLASKASRIYKSVEGVLPEQIECENATERLVNLSEKIRSSMPEVQAPPLGSILADTRALRDICRGCIEVSTELQSILRKLRLEGNTESRTRRKWDSFQEALRSIWSLHDIERLKTKLANFRAELQIHLILNIR